MEPNPPSPHWDDLLNLLVECLGAISAVLVVPDAAIFALAGELGAGEDGRLLAARLARETVEKDGLLIRTLGEVVVAGVPLEAGGAILVLMGGRRPATLDRAEERMLRRCAAQADAQLRLLRSCQALEDDRAALLKLVPDICWKADKRGRLIEISGHGADLTGVDCGAALGRRWCHLVHPADRKPLYREISRAAGGRDAIDMRVRLKACDGEWRWMRLRGVPTFDGGDVVRHWSGTSEPIHEQVLAAEALKRSRTNLHTVFNQAMIGILHRDLNNRVLMVNGRYCEIVGRSAEALSGLPMAAFTHPEDIEWNAPLYMRQSALGEPFQIEKRYVRPDGGIVWCAVHVSFVCDEKGVARSVITVAQDITERKQAEQELRESQDLLQTIVDSVADLIFVKDLSGRFVLANKAMTDGLGSILESDGRERLPAELAREYASADRRVIETGLPVVRDEQILFHGERRPFQTIKVPWRKGGKVNGVIGVSRDIGERLKNEQALRESEEHYRYSVELNPQIPWIANPDGEVIEVSSRWRDVTGGDPVSALGDAWINALHPEDAELTAIKWADAVRSGEPVDVEYRLRLPSGEYRWFRARGAARRDADGEIVRWYGTLEGIHDRKVAEKALRESEERFRLAAEVAGFGIWDQDTIKGRILLSDEFRKILGLPPDAIPSIETILALVHPEDRHSLSALLDDSKEGHRRRRFKATVRISRVSDGAERWVRIGGWRTITPAGRLARVLATIRDITDEQTANQRIRWAATHDALTRLPNRSAFQDVLDVLIRQAERSKERIALLLVDLDHLKETNDTLGHDAGDALIRAIAERLRTIVVTESAIARLGGDEFVVALPVGADEQEIAVTIESILTTLREPFAYEGHLLPCQATIGASLFPDHGDKGADLLKAADMALYAAKSASRGTMRLFRPEMRTAARRRASMIGLARNAVADDRVVPFYQPKIELSSGRLIGFEALLRWHHPGVGIQFPGDIAAAFDNLDLAVALGERMFERVIADMRHWLSQDIRFGRVAVNASAAEFRNDDFAERMLDRMAKAGIPPRQLELEVTETVFLGRGAEYVERALRTFSAEGVHIALDDFGTGFASLTHLKQFPVDIIKIDRSFVHDLAQGPDDGAIVDAVLNLGNSLNMGVVAEGIETVAQAADLLARGCHYGQGYLFGRALPASRIADIVREWDITGPSRAIEWACYGQRPGESAAM